MKKITRRDLLKRSAVVVSGSVLPNYATAAIPTPGAAEGPFYPTESMRRQDIDNDLVKIAGKVMEAGGEIILLKGRTISEDDKPLVGLRIEIWQCDVNGKYLHSGDDRSFAHDEGFQGFGHDITNEQGEYEFRTIMPTKYPGRAPHIHVKVSDEQSELLTTQFYIGNHDDNERDFLYRRMSREQAASVSMEFTLSDDIPTAVLDVVI